MVDYRNNLNSRRENAQRKCSDSDTEPMTQLCGSSLYLQRNNVGGGRRQARRLGSPHCTTDDKKQKTLESFCSPPLFRRAPHKTSRKKNLRLRTFSARILVALLPAAKQCTYNLSQNWAQAATLRKPAGLRCAAPANDDSEQLRAPCAAEQKQCGD